MSAPGRVTPATVRSRLLEVAREAIERLAPLDRTPCSAGEREAAEWLARRFAAIDGVEVALEDEPSWGTFPPTATGLGFAGTLGALLVLRGRRLAGALLAIGSFAGVVDEAHNGPRVLRRLVRRRRTTVNVVARTGTPAGDGIDTLVVLAHHDAAQTGLLFDQTLQRRIWERVPRLIESSKTPIPQWWLGLGGPLSILLAASSSRLRRLARVGLGAGLLGSALVLDVWRNPTVPGANDNLSGVACLLGLAERLREAPVEGLRVLLVSCGAEETLQDGVRAFVARHREELDPARTVFLNVDTIGSPNLVMLEAEGPVRMEYYTGPWLRDLVASLADSMDVELERGYRARASTDSVIPSRAGYPIATLVSITDWRMPANYHLPSDTPENIDYETVLDATLLAHELARSLRDGGAEVTS